MKNSAILLLALVTSAVTKSLEWRDLSNITPMNYQPSNLLKINSDSKDTRIAGGEIATPHSFPYQAALEIPTQGNGVILCGGSLIDSQWVLTAAHCLSSLTGKVSVILGAQDIMETESSQVMVNSSAVYIYPTWTQSQLYNDIALIKLSEKVAFNSNIKPVRLPSRSEQQTTYAALDSILTGWGHPSDGVPHASPELRYVTVPVMSNYDCNLIRHDVTDSQLCTSGVDKKAACSGDSGGPLVVTGSDGVKTQIGIASLGEKMCEMGFPTVYTRLTSFLDWISITANITINS